LVWEGEVLGEGAKSEAGAAGRDAEEEGELEEEIIAMDATFGEAFTAPALHARDPASDPAGRIECEIDGIPGMTTVELHPPPGGWPNYPRHPLIPIARNPSLSREATVALTAGLYRAAIQAAEEALPAIFTLYSWLQSDGADVATAPPPLAQLIPPPVTAAVKPPPPGIKPREPSSNPFAKAGGGKAGSGAGGKGGDKKENKGKGSGGKGGGGKGASRVVHHDAAALQSELSSRLSRESFTKMKKIRASLPAHKKREQVVQAVNQSQVVLVTGETGSGKTTQVPQFVIDDMDSRGQGAACSIVCTQPRRIAALGVAGRVAEEREEKIGDTVGYAIRGETKLSARTRLQFVTTGVLLRRLQGDPTLAGVSHVMVDEAHIFFMAFYYVIFTFFGAKCEEFGYFTM